jgi:hypothetical protein
VPSAALACARSLVTPKNVESVDRKHSKIYITYFLEKLLQIFIIWIQPQQLTFACQLASIPPGVTCLCASANWYGLLVTHHTFGTISSLARTTPALSFIYG